MMNLNESTIKELHKSLKEKQIKSEELVNDCLKKIESKKDLNAFITINKEQALKQAAKFDKKENQDLNYLAGITCAVKDNILVKDIKCTCGSKILAEYIAPYDATVVRKLKDSQSIICGKTNLDEFAMGSSTESSAFGPTKNPHDPTKVPGGSSGGSAAAVASDQVIFAIGSDTGGSVRQPASFCGIVGLKPTYGRVSRYGLTAMASSFDQIGWLTKTVEDSAILLQELAGFDVKDSTSVDKELKDNLKEIERDLKGFRIGVAKQFFVDGMDSQVETVVRNSTEKLKNLGAEIVEVDLPMIKYALAAYYLLMPSEVSSNMSRFDGVRYGLKIEGDDLMDTYLNTRQQGFGDEVKRRIMLGTFALSTGYYDAYYLKAQKVRAMILNEFKQIFNNIDCLATPTAPTTAFGLGEKTADPLTMYLEDIYTVPVNVAGLPAISIPCGKIGNLPVGLQLIGNQFQEHKILRVANQFELAQ